MSVSRVLASTRRRAAAADIRTHSWIAFMLDKKQPFVLTCTSWRPKPAHAAGSGFHARNDRPLSHVHASPAGNRTDHIRVTHAPSHGLRRLGIFLSLVCGLISSSEPILHHPYSNRAPSYFETPQIVREKVQLRFTVR